MAVSVSPSKSVAVTVTLRTPRGQARGILVIRSARCAMLDRKELGQGDGAGAGIDARVNTVLPAFTPPSVAEVEPLITPPML